MIDVPAGEAEAMLRLFARQARVQLIFDPQAVTGLHTNAVRGSHPPSEALRQLLAGLPLAWVVDPATGAFAIRKKSGKEITESESQRVLQGAPNQSGSGPPNPQTPMHSAPKSSASRSRWARLFAVVALLIGESADAQTPNPDVAKPETDPAADTIVLSPFTVTSSPGDNRYAPAEATSGGRVRVKVFESTQSISIVPQELIQDVGTSRVLDAAKFVAGVTEWNIPNGLERMVIRGFLSSGSTLDGFYSGGQSNLDPIIIDRIEVVKGPNAILSPNGTPGGTINNVSKKPLFRNANSISYEAGLFQSDRAELDINRVIGEKVAVRLLAAGQDTEDYVDGAYKHVWTVAPMFTYRFSRSAELTVLAQFTDWNILNNAGLPVDPSASSTNRAELLSGISREVNIAEDNFRNEEKTELRATFTGAVVENLSLRAAVRYLDLDPVFMEVNIGGGPTGGAIDPRTGLYTPGVVYGPAPIFQSSVATPLSRTFNRSGQWAIADRQFLNFQNDWYHEFTRFGFKAGSLAGYALTLENSSDYRRNLSKPAIDLDHPVSAAPTMGAVSRHQIDDRIDQQFYLSENLRLLNERLIVSGGYSWNWYDLSVENRLNNTITTAKVSDGLLSYGILAKPIPAVAVFYSYSAQSTPQGAPTIAAGGPALQTGEQREGGVRIEAFDRKLNFTATYFSIAQNNFSTTNPGNLAVPAPNPLLPNLLMDITSKGWEFELRASLTKQLSLIANYADFKARRPFDVPIANVAERSGVAWLRYDFAKESSLRGLNVSIGFDYVGKRAGDQPSGFTAASTPDHPILNQPTFYLPARTLANLAVGYRFSSNWSAQLNVSNLLDEQYLASSFNRALVYAGAPLNARLKATYRF